MTLSFSGRAKAEICQQLPQKRCCCQAMAFGVLLFANTFTDSLVRIVTESREFALLLPRLFWRAFRMEFDEFPSMEAPGKLVFQITEPGKLDFLLDAFGFDPDNTLALHVNLSVLEGECCRVPFLQGAFLAGGSVTDPGKGYHLEIATGHQAVGRETYAPCAQHKIVKILCSLQFQQLVHFSYRLAENRRLGIEMQFTVDAKSFLV